MENILRHAHSGLRWLVLAILLYAIVNAIIKRKKGTYTAQDKLLSILSISFTHLQIVLGFVMYFMTSAYKGFGEMGEAAPRFKALEHPLMMILGAVFITIGHVKAKKATDDVKKYTHTAVFFGIGLVLILARIPW